MLDILMYLFEHYIHGDVEVMIDHEELADELAGAGFDREDICKALDWLEKLASLQDSDINPYLLDRYTNGSIRIFTDQEMMKLDTESRGFLMFLEQVGVLDAETREMVIDRILELEGQDIDLEDLKWVILMVLFNVPGHENAYAQMEDLICDDIEGPLH